VLLQQKNIVTPKSSEVQTLVPTVFSIPHMATENNVALKIHISGTTFSLEHRADKILSVEGR
jgi:hypothetical protein